MKNISLILLILTQFVSCNTKNNETQDKNVLNGTYELTSICEYENHYENNLLVKVLREESFHMEAETMNLLNESIFHYDTNNILSKKENYDVKESGEKILSSYEIFNKLSKTIVEMNGTDTISFNQKFYDEKGNLIKERSKRKFLNSEHDISVDENCEKYYKYDLQNRLISIENKDYLNNQINNTIFEYEIIKDTLVKRVTTNNILDFISKKIETKQHTQELTFNSKGNLISTFEEILKNDTIYEIRNHVDIGHIETLISVKDMLVKEIEKSENRESIILKEYDNKRNIISEKKYLKGNYKN